MNMKTTVTITKFPETFGELENLKPAGYGTNQIPEGEMTFDNGVPMQDPATQKDRDLWQRMFLSLHDVPMPGPGDWGLSLLLVDAPDGTTTIQYGYPSKTNTPRSFSITGDGTAPSQVYDGSADVILTLTNLQAAKWKTPRTINVIGTFASGSVTFDGSADANLDLTVEFANSAGEAALANHALTADNATNATNAVNATNATNATNANHANTATSATTATTATTANNLANSAITVTLTGDVTGTGNISGGVVTIPTTASGGGNPGGDTPNGQLILGSVQQVWGRQITSTDASPGLRGFITINFDPPFISADAYTYKAEVELAEFTALVPYIVRYVTKTASQLVLRLKSADDTEGLASYPLSYFIVGNIS